MASSQIVPTKDGDIEIPNKVALVDGNIEEKTPDDVKKKPPSVLFSFILFALLVPTTIINLYDAAVNAFAGFDCRWYSEAGMSPEYVLSFERNSDWCTYTDSGATFYANDYNKFQLSNTIRNNCEDLSLVMYNVTCEVVTDTSACAPVYGNKPLPSFFTYDYTFSNCTYNGQQYYYINDTLNPNYNSYEFYSAIPSGEDPDHVKLNTIDFVTAALALLGNIFILWTQFRIVSVGRIWHLWRCILGKIVIVGSELVFIVYVVQDDKVGGYVFATFSRICTGVIAMMCVVVSLNRQFVVKQGLADNFLIKVFLMNTDFFEFEDYSVVVAK